MVGVLQEKVSGLMFECKYLNYKLNSAAIWVKKSFYEILRIVILSHSINSNCKLEHMLQKALRWSIHLEREHKCLFHLRQISRKGDNFQQTVASDLQADKICILVTSYFSRFLVHSVFWIKDSEIPFQSFSLFHN